MKILHTADLHLGRTINGISLLNQQSHCLNQIIDYLKNNSVDYIIIAGDIFDRSVPSKEAIGLANDFITKINKLKIPLIIISGNHDSSERLSFLSQVLNHQDIFIVSDEIDIQKIEFKNITFYCSPYHDYLKIANFYQDNSIKDCESALNGQLENVKLDENKINIFIGHNFFANDTTLISDSERPLQLGGMKYIPIHSLQKFDYVALGHLHQAQKINVDKIRYSGSIYKYSESEVNHRKSFTIIDIDKNKFNYELQYFSFEKDVKIIEGFFDDIIKNSSNDYIYFNLLDENIIVDAMNRLLPSYPNALSIKYISNKNRNHEFTQKSIENNDFLTLFKEYFELTHDKPISQKQIDIIQSLLKEYDQ